MKRLTWQNYDMCQFCGEGACCEHYCDNTFPVCDDKAIYDRLTAIEDILGEEYDLDELMEMVQAKRKGRCVVQKFAPGSEVWIVERDEDGEAAEVSGFVFVVSVSGIAIVSPSINGCSDLDFILSDFVEETASNFSGDFSGYPISDCYKSHEEAQAALRREQDGE